MTTPEIERRPAALWKAMTDAQRLAAAEAFWADDESVAEQTEVMLLLSKKLNFRYKSVEGMAPERKTTHLLKLAQVSEGVAGSGFGTSSVSISPSSCLMPRPSRKAPIICRCVAR